MIYFLLGLILGISISSLHLRLTIRVKDLFDKMGLIFLICVLIHTSFVLICKTFFPTICGYISFFFSLLYTPVLYYGFLGLKGESIEQFSVFFKKNILYFITLLLYVIALILRDLNLIPEFSYDVFLYAVLIFAWLFYPLRIILDQSGIKDFPEENRLLLNLSYISITVFIYIVLFNILDKEKEYEFMNDNIISYLLICLLLMTASICSYFIEHLKVRNSTDKSATPVETPVKPSDPKEETPDKDNTKNYRKEIDEYMLTKPYLNKQYNLGKFASDLKISTHKASEIINNIYDMNFSKFINSKRIDHACELLHEKGTDINMEELAEECGFNSRASFYRNFKEIKK